MSRPATDLQIDDVLSSIRRLVTQGQAASPDSHDRPEPERHDEAGEKLILGPSLRVTEQVSPDADPPEDDDAPDRAESAEAQGGPDEAAGPDDDDPGPLRLSAVGDTPSDGDNAPPLVRPAPMILRQRVLDRRDDEAEDADGPDDGSEARIERAADDETPDAHETAPSAEMDGAEESEVASSDIEAGPDGDTEDHAQAPLEFRRTVHALEDPIDETAEVDVPDVSDADPETDRAIETPSEEIAEPSQDDTPFAEPEAEVAAGPVAADAGGDSAGLDRDLLKGIVAEVLREELEGALGKRLTANLRELIRSEVHSAIAAVREG